MLGFNIMEQQFDEIRHAIQNIHRNFTILSTSATPDQMILIEQGQQDIEEFEEYSMTNIKKSFGKGA
jgi:hypothetical protein